MTSDNCLHLFITIYLSDVKCIENGKIKIIACLSENLSDCLSLSLSLSFSFSLSLSLSVFNFAYANEHNLSKARNEVAL